MTVGERTSEASAAREGQAQRERSKRGESGELSNKGVLRQFYVSLCNASQLRYGTLGAKQPACLLTVLTKQHIGFLIAKSG